MATREFADISSAGQHAGDFNAVEYRKGGALLIGIKATEGGDFENPFHHQWAHAAHVAGVGVIHYHFYSPNGGSSPERQADWFWKIAGPYVGPFDFICDDYEQASHQGVHVDCENAQRFSARLHHKTRFDPITYTYRAFLEPRGTGLVPGRKRVWLADYSSFPSIVPAGCSTWARQHTDGIFGPTPHGLRGVAGRCDVSTLNAAAFRHLVLNARRDHRAHP